eukprot:4688991-Alexandrium_andersonii.AAC.1
MRSADVTAREVSRALVSASEDDQRKVDHQGGSKRQNQGEASPPRQAEDRHQPVTRNLHTRWQ